MQALRGYYPIMFSLICVQHNFDQCANFCVGSVLPVHPLLSFHSPVLADVAKLRGNGFFNLPGNLLCFRLCNTYVLRDGKDVFGGWVPAVTVHTSGVFPTYRIAVG